jgi:hypothetical protein
MEGGGTSELFVLGDIGDYKNLDDMYPIVSAAVVGVNAAIAFARFGSLGGISLNAYYDTLGLEGVLANVTYLTIVFQLARWLYSTFYTSGGRPWSPFVFVCILIAIELINDLILYYGPVSIVPSGKNEMIDILKRYAAENGSRALAGHAAFLIFVAVAAMFYKESSNMFVFLAVVTSLYTMTFMLTTAGSKPPPPPPPPEKKKTLEERWNGPRF